MLSGISSLGFSSCLGMVMFFSEIFGVDNAEGTVWSAFVFGATGTSATVGVDVTAVGVSATGFVVVGVVTTGVDVFSAGVELTPLLFFLKGQLRWTARPSGDTISSGTIQCAGVGFCWT